MKKLFYSLNFFSLLLMASPFRPTNIAFPLHAPDTSLVKFANNFPALTFSHPVFMAFAPDNSGKVFVVEQTGLIKIFPNINSVTTAQTFADFTHLIYFDGAEMGLLGLAFSPDYAKTKELFVSYTANNPNRLIVARLNVSATNPNQADMQSLQTVIVATKTFAQYGNHNGGMIAFGPDRKLYIGIGDGGGAGDIFHNAQNKNILFGKILRIDPLSAKPYAIPADNPFVGEADVKEEIWTYGMRNPWRFSFDKETGDLMAGDVGQDTTEEIDIIKRGANYGWSIFEAHKDYNNPDHLPHDGFTFPIWEYPHGAEIAITGGYTYRGKILTELVGSYIYGDYGSGKVWALQRNGDEALSNYQIGAVNQPSSFSEDLNGELYALAYAEGKIYKLEKNTVTTPVVIPKLLSQTGIFSNTPNMLPVAGLQEYDVGSPLWSDGAAKRRWIGLPATGTIVFSDKSYWTFPVGTIFVKHFELNTKTNPHKKLETRVLFHHSEGWRGYTYVWNDAETDAALIDESQSKTLEVVDETSGEVKLQSWYFPGRQDCLRCHTFSAGYILGANTGQLNHDFQGVNFLTTMNNAQVFNKNIGDPTPYTKFVDPSDNTIELEPRVRSYLAANCAQCHNPLGAAPGQMDFRYSSAEADMNVVEVKTTDSSANVGSYRVDPGHPENSALYNRMNSLEAALRMPPLSTSVQDQQGLDLIHEWILSHGQN